jgi:hypothetical protein
VDAAGETKPRRRKLDQALITRIADVVDQWRKTSTVDERDNDIATAVPALELLGADVNLVPARHIQPEDAASPDERTHDLTQALARLSEAHTTLSQSNSDVPTIDIAAQGEWVSVRDLVAGDVAEVNRGVRIKPVDCLNEGVRVLRTRDIRDTIGNEEPCFVIPDEMKPRPVLTRPGDIIVSPASGKLRALVDEEGDHVLASPLQALRFRSEWLDPYVAAAFLESPRNRRFASGTSWGFARINLQDLELPLLPLAEAHRLREALDQLATTARRAGDLAQRAQEVRETLINVIGQAGGAAWK